MTGKQGGRRLSVPTWRDVVLHERLVMAARKSLPSISDV